MEGFKKSIKTRLTMSIILTTAVVTGIVIISHVIYKTRQVTGYTESFMLGFQIGLFTAGILLEVLHIYSLRKALNSEEELRKLYIKETDERVKAIKNKIAHKGFWITAGALLVASIVAGFYSVTVFVTLLAVLLFMLIIAVISKCVYYKIM